MDMLKILLLLTLFLSCGKSGSSGKKENLFSNKYDPCFGTSYCTNETAVESISDIPEFFKLFRRDQSARNFGGVKVGLSFIETEIMLDNKYDWDSNTFFGNCIQSIRRIKTVKSIDRDNTDFLGDKYDELTIKVEVLDRQLITETKSCISEFNNSRINTDAYVETISLQHKTSFMYPIEDEELFSDDFDSYNISVLKFNGRWALRVSDKETVVSSLLSSGDIFPGVYHSADVTIVKASSATIYYPSYNYPSPMSYQAAYLGDKLVYYRNTFYGSSWFDVEHL
jgi:hypothetical protein